MGSGIGSSGRSQGTRRNAAQIRPESCLLAGLRINIGQSRRGKDGPRRDARLGLLCDFTKGSLQALSATMSRPHRQELRVGTERLK